MSTAGAQPDQPAVTAELVLSRLRAAGGKLVISGVSEEEFTAWRRAAKVAQLRLLRAGRQRLNRWTDSAEMRLELDIVQATDADDDDLTDEDYEALFRPRFRHRCGLVRRSFVAAAFQCRQN